MGTTKTDTTTGQFAPGQLQNLQNLQGISVPLLSGWMQNPTGNPWFQLQQQLGTKQAQNLGGMQLGNVARNLTASGLGGGGSTSPFAMEMLQNQGRANTGLQSQLGFLNPMQNAQQLQTMAAGMAQNYRPFQTGQQQTEKTSGLGTWLPQVANLAMGVATGGLSGMMPGGGPFGSANNYAPMSPMQPWGGGGQGAFGEGGAGIPWAGAGGGGPAGGGMGGNLGLGGASGGCLPGINC